MFRARMIQPAKESARSAHKAWRSLQASRFHFAPHFMAEQSVSGALRWWNYLRSTWADGSVRWSAGHTGTRTGYQGKIITEDADRGRNDNPIDSRTDNHLICRGGR